MFLSLGVMRSRFTVFSPLHQCALCALTELQCLGQNNPIPITAWEQRNKPADSQNKNCHYLHTLMSYQIHMFCSVEDNRIFNAVLVHTMTGHSSPHHKCDWETAWFRMSYIYRLLGPLDYTPCHRETQIVTDRREVMLRQQIYTSIILPVGSELVCWASVAPCWWALDERTIWVQYVVTVQQFCWCVIN